MVRVEQCVRLNDGDEDNIAGECYGSMLKTIDSDEPWRFLLHLF